MINKKNERLLSFFIGSSGYLVPRPLNEYVKISKTMYPYLLGKRNNFYFYNLEKSLYGTRAMLEILKNIIANEGKIIFISDLFKIKSRFALEYEIDFIKSKRGSLIQSQNIDLVLLTKVEKENLIEVHRKSLLTAAVGSSTMSKISYPINLNIDSHLLSDWFLASLYISCVQGKRKKRYSEKKPKNYLLGKGSLKGYSKNK